MDDRTAQAELMEDAPLGTVVGERLLYQFQIQPTDCGWVDYGMPIDDRDATERKADFRFAEYPDERVRIIELVTVARVVYLDGESVE